MKSVYNISAYADNTGLTKDFAAIPYSLLINYGYDGHVVCPERFKDSLDNRYLFNGLKFDYFENKFKYDLLNILLYITKNYRKIDILIHAHLCLNSIIIFLFYKLLNRKGIIYLNMDCTYEAALYLTEHSGKLSDLIKCKLSVFLFKHLIDFASIATKNAHDVFINYNDIYKEKLLYKPCGIDPFPEIDGEKKNQIICVGRIGSKQKASDVLLESFKLANKKSDRLDNWILKVVGPISDDFYPFIDNFFKENPNLKDKIVFTGNICDRASLYKLYSESKIFCLPSRWESFGIVFPESLYYGNFLLVPDVGVGKYLIEKSKFGRVIEIDDVEDISDAIVESVENYDEYVKNINIDFKEFIYNEFSSNKSCETIHNKIQSIKS